MNIYHQHSYNRSVGWSTWHLQWCTKYRYKVFYVDKHRELCKILMHETAKRNNFNIFDLEVDLNHVHVLASLPLTMNPSYAVKLLKGNISRGLLLEVPYFRYVYKNGHLWSPGKFIGSVGHITLEKARDYLEAHHAKSTGIPLFQTWEDVNSCTN